MFTSFFAQPPQGFHYEYDPVCTSCWRAKFPEQWPPKWHYPTEVETCTECGFETDSGLNITRTEAD